VRDFLLQHIADLAHLGLRDFSSLRGNEAINGNFNLANGCCYSTRTGNPPELALTAEIRDGNEIATDSNSARMNPGHVGV
jgi:hypothetical protein